MKTYNWEGVNPDGYFLDKLEPIPSALPSFQKLFQVSGFNRTLDAINNVFRKFSAFHDETGRLNVDGMNIISNDGSNKLNSSRKARVSYKVQLTLHASLNAATSTRAVSSNPNFVTRQKIEIIFG